MSMRRILWDVVIAAGICAGVYLVAVFSQGTGIQFVYVAF
jgi:hypothetical protein